MLSIKKKSYTIWQDPPTVYSLLIDITGTLLKLCCQLTVWEGNCKICDILVWQNVLLMELSKQPGLPLRQHACFMLFKGNKMWKADTIMYHSSCLQTLTKKMFSNCNSLYSGFPVHHESAYEAFHWGNHTCRAISGGGDLLLIFRGIGTKRAGGSTTHSLHWEDWFDPFDVDLLLKVKTEKGKWKCRNWSSFLEAFATSRFLFIKLTIF